MPKITHEDYWKARTDEILRYVDKTDLDIYQELIKLYTEAATDIQKELYAFVLKYAEENNLTYREALKQLRDTDLSDYRENAKRYFEESKKNPELLKRLNEQYVSSKATRMDAMNLEIEYRLGILKQTVEGTFEDYLKKTALYTYSKIGRGFNSSSLNEKVLIKLIQTPFNGANYAESVGLNVDELAKSIKEVLRAGFIKGSHPRVMAQELMKKVNISRSRAQTIIRTDGTMVINNSIAQRYIDAGLKHYRILVHMDDRTTKICRKHYKEKKVYDLKDFKPGITAPPFHYNCRSAIIPDKDELNEDISEYNPEFGEMVDAQEKEIEAEKVSISMLKSAKRVEPAITEDLKRISKEANGIIAGLEYRIKTKESLKRKIFKDAIEKDVAVRESANEINDVLRYTTLFDNTTFVNDYKSMKTLLIEEGYAIIKVKNSWKKGSPYKGINTIIEKNGIKFEMQYHTAESFDLKNGLLHKLFEKDRELNTKPKDRAKLNQSMIKLSSKLETPPGIEEIK